MQAPSNTKYTHVYGEMSTYLNDTLQQIKL